MFSTLCITHEAKENRSFSSVAKSSGNSYSTIFNRLILCQPQSVRKQAWIIAYYECNKKSLDLKSLVSIVND